MKRIPKFFALVLLAMSIASLSAFAQGASADLAGAMRYIVLDPGTSTPATSAVTVSNTPVDIHGYDGVGVILLGSVCTNAAATIYARVETSSTGTNGWTLMSNCALFNLSTNTLSNLAQNGIGATNTYLIPGTATVPTAGTAGFASTYLAPSPYTNTGILLTNVAQGVAAIGFVVADQPRYIHTIYTVTGGTNDTTAIFVARKNSGSFY